MPPNDAADGIVQHHRAHLGASNRFKCHQQHARPSGLRLRCATSGSYDNTVVPPSPQGDGFRRYVYVLTASHCTVSAQQQQQQTDRLVYIVCRFPTKGFHSFATRSEDLRAANRTIQPPIV